MSATFDHDLPPLTNRGVVRPEDRQSGGVDYLKLTVWAPPKEVCDIIERGVLDKYGWGVDPMSIQEDWIEKAAGGRVSQIFDAGCLCVLEYTEEMTVHSEFCSVEVKGRGCERLGNEGIRLLLDDLKDRYRIRASRVDVMAHTEMFSPREVYEAVQRENISSRSASPKNLIFTTSSEGDTCYLGMVSKPAGGIRRSGQQVLRVYNRRGTTRVELQMSEGYAYGAGAFLYSTPVKEWPTLIRGMMRHYCDFVDRAANERVTRCPKLPWWAEFVENVEKISVRPADNHYDTTPIGKVDGILDRYARRLFAAQEAFGKDWINQRIERHGKLKKNEEHQTLVDELERYKGTKIAGAPARDEDIPF